MRAAGCPPCQNPRWLTPLRDGCGSAPFGPLTMPIRDPIQSTSNDKTTNAFSVDVEDYFQVSALDPYVARRDWGSIACRVEANVDRLLALLAERDTRATFFVLGWIAQRYPNLIRRIAEGGHEIASHGFGHDRIGAQSRQQFQADVQHTKTLLEDITSIRVRGYRAPSFSIGPKTQWAYDVLAETGHLYSSSVYPVRHDHYGWASAPRFAHFVGGRIWELPPASIRLFGQNIPAGGGGYFRLYPYALSSWLIGRLNRLESQPALFYCHPWEIDAEQPTIKGLDYRTRFRHTVNLSRNERRLRQLLADYRWDRLDAVYQFVDRAGDDRSR